MSDILKNRTEILFLYDIENANPNGDPLNENRPRFDSETNTVLVSDVRLKRTIRDFWYEYKGFNGKDGKDIFVRETLYKIDKDDKEYVADGKRRAKDKDFKEDKNKILNICIDIRVFGGVLPLEDSSITFTGPTQFQMGRSLNKVEIITEQGTGAFASGDRKQQATFRTEYKVPYAIIGFNGIINEKAAQYSKMTEDDKNLLLEGIWDGTKNLISRSKYGQSPLFLLTVNYKEPFYIGNLRQKLSIVSEKIESQLRNTSDYAIDITKVLNELKTFKEKISGVELKTENRLKMIYNNQEFIHNSGMINLNEL
jgi:CRISPR-associated protein Csh2